MKIQKLYAMALAVATTVLALALLAAPSFAQSMSAQIPFDFYANDKLMPAGSYTARVNTDRRVVTIEDGKGNATLVLAISEVSRVSENNRLVFNRYGNMNFLSAVSWRGLANGQRIAISKLQLEATKNGSPTQVAIESKK